MGLVDTISVNITNLGNNTARIYVGAQVVLNGTTGSGCTLGPAEGNPYLDLPKFLVIIPPNGQQTVEWKFSVLSLLEESQLTGSQQYTAYAIVKVYYIDPFTGDISGCLAGASQEFTIQGISVPKISIGNIEIQT